jgi:hypothetical protein
VCASTNLVTWTNISQIVLTNGVATFVDGRATNNPHNFYRSFPQ